MTETSRPTGAPRGVPHRLTPPLVNTRWAREHLTKRHAQLTEVYPYPRWTRADAQALEILLNDECRPSKPRPRTTAAPAL